MTSVECYVPGDALRFRATLYLGNDYNNALPSAFLHDVMATTNPVCWFRYNLWQLATNSAFETKFGFRFEYMDSSGFPQIEYRGETFVKNQLDAELGRSTIVDSGRARAVALARQLPSSNSIPYIVNGSNFWYVGDIPFSYISEEDRYRQQTPKSRRFFAEAREYLPGGDSRSTLFHRPYPAVMDRGRIC